MTHIDTLYDAAIDNMSVKEKIARSVAIFNWSREFAARQVREANPDACPEVIRLLVALRIYGHEPQIKSMIESLLAENVSD